MLSWALSSAIGIADRGHSSQSAESKETEESKEEETSEDQDSSDEWDAQSGLELTHSHSGGSNGSQKQQLKDLAKSCAKLRSEVREIEVSPAFRAHIWDRQDGFCNLRFYYNSYNEPRARGCIGTTYFSQRPFEESQIRLFCGKAI